MRDISETVTVYSAVSPDDPYVFVDCRWKVDPTGCLHVFRAAGAPQMVAAFAAHSWSLVHAAAQVSS